MYAYNTIARRRPAGWAERRRYFKRLLAKTNAPPAKEAKKTHTT